jgi:tetratricopeptide (TPR) repeat protein
MLTAMLDRKYRGRRKGIAIREGSVRQAREQARLSLAQIANNEVSRTAIHLIEKGRVKPSVEMLELIARQTGKPIEYFLLDPNASSALIRPKQEVRELERLTVVREFGTVVALGLELLATPSRDEETGLIHFYVGQAYCRLVKPQDALRHLPQARAQFERQHDQWLAVDALDWEASAWGLLEDPRAIGLASEALERCRRLDPRPGQLEARILGHIAGMHLVARSWTLAIGDYEAAVEAARAVKDLLQMAKMHHGLGTAYQRLQQPSKARQHFDKAIALYSIESDLSAVYRVENDLGDLLLQEGQVEAAEQHFLRALAGADELHLDRRGRGYILLNLGEVNLRKGRLDEAQGYLEEALAVGEALGERIVGSNVKLLLGRLHEQRGNHRDADEQFLAAIRTVEGLDMPDRLRDCHMAYGEVLDQRGDSSSAARHWRLAAEIGKAAALGIALRRTAGDLGGRQVSSAS